ncbi:MAG: DUF1552 domain-containing protein [Mariniblastus sp.]
MDQKKSASRSVNFNFRKCVNRRTILRGTGVSLALPWLGAMQPAFATESEQKRPKRFVAMTLGLGLHSPNLNPTETGRGYKPSRYLKAIDDIRDKFSVISGVSHPGVGGGHRAEASILTANPAGSSGRAKNSISVDQLLAKHLGSQTRFPSLVLSSAGSSSPSYTENGSMVPAESSPSKLFERLFVNDSEAEREQHALRVREGRSIMDLVNDDAKRFQKKLGKGDQQRLDAYFSSVRDLEKRMAASEAWASRPKPKVDVGKPIDILDSRDFIGQQKMMSDMIRLALQTDSSRFVVYHLGGGGGVVPIDGVEEGYHGLSHHGLNGEKLEQLAIVEGAIIAAWGEFLRGLNSIDNDGESLLDQTSVLLTSNLGNASNHSNKNMPVLFAGGGFKHGQHLAFDQKRNYPLPNLFVSVLQKLGLETDQFMSSTGTMTGLS